eukprot:gene32101-38820_t
MVRRIIGNRKSAAHWCGSIVTVALVSLCLIYGVVFRQIFVHSSIASYTQYLTTTLYGPDVVSRTALATSQVRVGTPQTSTLPLPAKQGVTSNVKRSKNVKKGAQKVPAALKQQPGQPLRQKGSKMLRQKPLEQEQIKHRQQAKDQPQQQSLKKENTLPHYVYQQHVPFSFPTKNLPSRDLIIAMACHLDPHNLIIFTASLRQTSKDTVLVLLVDESFTRKTEFFSFLPQDAGIIYLVIPEGFTVRGLEKAHESTLRFVLYERLLGANIVEHNQILVNPTTPTLNSTSVKSLFDYVLIVDARDTVFQTNPFALIKNSLSATNPTALKGVHVFLEESIIGTCGWNKGWIVDCFGESVLSLVQHNSVLCSGVTMGDMHSMYVYIHAMSSIMQGKRLLLQSSFVDPSQVPFAFTAEKAALVEKINSFNKFPRCERNGVDQGLHNVLMHLGLLGGANIHIHKHEHFSYPVINMQTAMLIVSHRVDKGKVYMSGGQLYSIVHQYDRHTELQQQLVTRYLTGLVSTNPIEEFTKSPDCAGYVSVADADVLKRRCDLSSKRALTFGACCSLCNREMGAAASCTGFAYSGGICYFKQCSVVENQAVYARTRHDLLAAGFEVEKGVMSALRVT